ncbi:MAG: hypothetical protein A3D95_05370 [Betaproteobacteria bacterium RIFCSPHIGHO2_12_FULL_69_13]|nr:MAG: hypothetical protein A3D95_05370 [Betaproteobacteria bacterium RIFCSPHIGHO2_12_FULL_69_13]OGA69032.1 MAG: hypothetical protein A3G83_04900 [Betaproteobacteria bacterium RIFCSPLOWO2_12_FULL_68_20]
MAGRLGKLRQRFGIAAPRVAVRGQIPWYWRWLGIALLLVAAMLLAAWIYDAGGRFAGFDRSEITGQLGETRRSLDAARAELEQLRGVANAADSRVSIERTAQQKLARQIRTLGQENARLREELAIFENMLSSEARSAQALSIYRFKVEPEVLPGEYRYHLLLLTPTSRRGRDFQGRLELVVSLTEGGRSAMMSFPEQADAGASAFRLAFKYFQRVEGTFRVSPKAKVENVQVRVYETGAPQPKATHTVTLR